MPPQGGERILASLPKGQLELMEDGPPRCQGCVLPEFPPHSVLAAFSTPSIPFTCLPPSLLSCNYHHPPF